MLTFNARDLQFTLSISLLMNLDIWLISSSHFVEQQTYSIPLLSIQISTM